MNNIYVNNTLYFVNKWKGICGVKPTVIVSNKFTENR